MFSGKLYSVWIDGYPAPALSVYVDDGEAISAFRKLILAVRSDVKNGLLEPDSDSNMELFCHGYFHDNGTVDGFVSPNRIMGSCDVYPESEGECEVVE